MEEPGSYKAVQQGCTCKPIDGAVALDVVWAMIDAVHGGLSSPQDSSSLPVWDASGCPLHGSR